MQDKSLAVLGANISNVQKSFDDQLKKRKDTQKTIKDKLRALTQKSGNKLTDKDLADAVYEKIQDIGKEKFIQSHNPEGNNYSELMTSVLVVIN
jgi:Tfp pilus assembly major pilin PilA